jgi:hypothetical protein
MKSTKIRTMIAAAALGAVAVTGVFAVSAAGAASNDTAPAAAGRLTQDQKDCLTAHGITRPDHKLTADERAALKTQRKAAADACGITPPAGAHPKARAFIKNLTQDQKDCLKGQGITRPDHRLTKDERQDFVAKAKAAAGTCGITLPGQAATN